MSNSRRRGHNFERRIRKWFVSLGWVDTETSRAESRNLDNRKIDLAYTQPYAIQCKSSKFLQNYVKLIDEIETDQSYRIPMVFHEYVEKKGKRFYKKGDYVIMKLEHLEEILEFVRNTDGSLNNERTREKTN